jgi:hypothetical protein
MVERSGGEREALRESIAQHWYLPAASRHAS